MKGLMAIAWRQVLTCTSCRARQGMCRSVIGYVLAEQDLAHSSCLCFLLRAHCVTACATIMRPQGMRRTALGACMQMGQSSAPIVVTLSTLLPHPLEWHAPQGSLCSVHAGTTPRNTWRGHHLRRNSRRHMLLCACISFETNSQHSLSTLLLLLILHRRSSPSKCTKWRATSASDIKGRGRGSLSL